MMLRIFCLMLFLGTHLVFAVEKEEHKEYEKQKELDQHKEHEEYDKYGSLKESLEHKEYEEQQEHEKFDTLEEHLKHEAEESAGEKLFEKRCGVCHKLPNPSNIPEEGWEKRLDKMARVARLKSKQKEEVLKYLLSHSKSQTMTVSLAEDLKLVEQKCTTCHSVDRVLIESLKGDKGAHIVERMKNYANPDWASEGELKRILAFLEKNEPKSPPVLDNTLPVEKIFAARCSVCHSLERVYDKLRTGVSSDYFSHVIARMQSKAPQWVQEDEARLIHDYLNDLRKKPGPDQ